MRFYTFLVWTLLQPYPLLLAFLGLGLANLWRRRRETVRVLTLVTIPFLCLLVFSFPGVAYVLRGSLEWRYPPLKKRPSDAEAIVVLSSGIYLNEGPSITSVLNDESRNRCLRAVEMYRQGEARPILLTGGKSDPAQPGLPCAQVMRRFLLGFGIPKSDLIVEPESRTTFENAVASAQILEARHIRKVILVTDATHMPRAAGCFRKFGIEVIPCGCQYQTTTYSESRWNFWPSTLAITDFQHTAHELMGLAWYWLTGRI